jgi:hypothetical protein
MPDIHLSPVNGHDRAAANRANSLKSTGPRSEPGKQRSSLNALRHGFTGHTVVLPTEDHAAYQRHTRRFFDQFRPSGPLEEQLVQSIADSAWRLNRVPAIETNLLTLGLIDREADINTGHPEARAALAAAQTFRDHASAFALLTVYEQRISRLFAKTLEQLRQIQAERREKEQADFDRAADLLELHQENEQLPYNPLRDGFVFSTAEIQSFIERRDRLYQAAMPPSNALPPPGDPGNHPSDLKWN